MSSKRPKRRKPSTELESNQHNQVETVQAISEAVTSQVMDNLRAAGILPQTVQVSANEVSSPTMGQTTTADIHLCSPAGRQGTSCETPITIPAQDVVSCFDRPPIRDYKPLGRPLHSKINQKLQEKIRSGEFVDLSDILVDHQPAELNLHLAVKNQKIGLASGKKRKFLTVESWTDAFAIFASVIRKANPTHPTIAEDLAIYMDLIRQIQKDGGDWFFYDVQFRQAMQNDDTLSWSMVDQVLYTRALNKAKSPLSPQTSKPFHRPAPRKTCHKFNGGRECNGFCGYAHVCYGCRGNHPITQCPNPSPNKGQFVKKAGQENHTKPHSGQHISFNPASNKSSKQSANTH
jgi:hypothetical protein